ncbi:MAG: hypothetical protein EXQ69_04305 [Acidimicrobiia bacterium]|nr:hypothetical protein [Acidimicrobiia bacterium]
MLSSCLTVAIWLVATAIVNTALRSKTSEEWVLLAETKPRLAAVIRIFRAVGLDPSKLITALAALLNAKAESLAAEPVPVSKLIIGGPGDSVVAGTMGGTNKEADRNHDPVI